MYVCMYYTKIKYAYKHRKKTLSIYLSIYLSI